MTESTLPDYAVPAQTNPLTRRRIFFTLIVLASMAGLIWLLAYALTAGGFTVVAAGISEALVATALGLGIAIIALIFYNYFQVRIGNISGLVRIQAMKLLQSVVP